jgi:hypothetical protein
MLVGRASREMAAGLTAGAEILDGAGDASGARMVGVLDRDGDPPPAEAVLATGTPPTVLFNLSSSIDLSFSGSGPTFL